MMSDVTPDRAFIDPRGSIAPNAERIILGDDRKARIRRTADNCLVVTYGRGEGSELFRTPIGMPAELPFARNRVSDWAASLKPAPALPPVLDAIARAERIADLVLRRREIVAELSALDAEIDGALS